MRRAVVSLDLVDQAELPPPTFGWRWKHPGADVAWIRVAGELDLATVPQLEIALREAQLHPRPVVLDLREVAFMDGCAVHVVVDASIRARQAGHRLALLRGPPNVDRIFALTGARDQVEIRDAATGR